MNMVDAIQSDGVDEATLSTRQRRYNKNKERENAESKLWRRNNPDKVKEYNRRYREQHKDKLDSRRREHYNSNQERYINYSINRAKVNREYVNAFKLRLGCGTCGINDVDILEFHHVDPNTKKDTIAAMVSSATQQAIYEELQKCIVLCANCHKKLEAKKRRGEA